MFTVKTALQKYAAPDQAVDAVLLLAHILKKEKEFIITHNEYPLSLAQKIRFHFLLWRRAKGVPLAYLLGHKEFYGLDFIVNKHTLVPRPDTELLVEEVIKKIQPGAILVDIGTGSGCIPISILKNLNGKQIKAFATDIASGALRTAQKNAARHNVSITFLRGNLLTPITKICQLFSQQSPLFIIANLPYGWHEWKNNSSVNTVDLRFEPANALFTDEYGLKLYRQLLEQLAMLKCRATCFFEFDPRQTTLLLELIKKNFPHAEPEIKTDLAGRDRLVIFSFNS